MEGFADLELEAELQWMASNLRKKKTVVVEPFVNLAFLDLEDVLQLSLLCKARDGYLTSF